MSQSTKIDKTRYLKGAAALFLACLLNYVGDRLLGVEIELYSGLKTFGGLWAVDVFILPFFVGMLAAVIFGFGGKWLSYFPPLIVRSINYYQFASLAKDIPPDASLTPIGWWGFMVILAIEASAFGGIMGEIMMKGTYGRSPRHKVYKEKSDNKEGDPET